MAPLRPSKIDQVESTQHFRPSVRHLSVSSEATPLLPYLFVPGCWYLHIYIRLERKEKGVRNPLIAIQRFKIP
jgi:hypothetical protein